MRQPPFDNNHDGFGGRNRGSRDGPTPNRSERRERKSRWGNANDNDHSFGGHNLEENSRNSEPGHQSREPEFSEFHHASEQSRSDNSVTESSSPKQGLPEHNDAPTNQVKEPNDAGSQPDNVQVMHESNAPEAHGNEAHSNQPFDEPSTAKEQALEEAHYQKPEPASAPAALVEQTTFEPSSGEAQIEEPSMINQEDLPQEEAPPPAQDPEPKEDTAEDQT